MVVLVDGGHWCVPRTPAEFLTGLCLQQTEHHNKEHEDEDTYTDDGGNESRPQLRRSRLGQIVWVVVVVVIVNVILNRTISNGSAGCGGRIRC